MGNRVTARKVKAKELSPGLRHRFHLVPQEVVSITVTRKTVTKRRARKDPWAEIRGILSPDEADEMLRTIHCNRRNKGEAPQIDAP